MTKPTNPIAFGAVLGGMVLGGLSLQACAPTRAQLVSEPRCSDFAFQVYFNEESAQIPRAARRVIADASAQAKGCAVKAVNVVGLADYRGPPEPNLTLSRQRAEAVAVALTKSHFPAPGFTVQAVGQAGAMTTQGQVEPLRRRADVYVSFIR